MINMGVSRILAIMSVALGTWLFLPWFPGLYGMTAPPLWLQANLQTASLLVTMGVALAFRASKEQSFWPHRIASWLAGGTFLFASVVLVQSLFGIDLGLDLAHPRQIPTYLTPNPGRMSPNSCMAFMAAGAAIWMFHPVQRAKYRDAFVWTVGLLVVIAGTALLGHLLGLERLYRLPMHNQMPYPSVMGLLTLALGIWYLRVGTGKTGSQNAKDPVVLEKRITRRAIVTLTLVAVGGGLAGFTAMRETFERSVLLSTEQATSTYATALENSLETSLWFPTTVASRPTVTQTLAALNVNAMDPAAKEFLPKLAASFLTADIDGVRFFDNRGTQLLAVGKFTGDRSEVVNNLAVEGVNANLRWNDGYLLRTEVPVVHEGHRVGMVSTEQRLDMFDRLMSQWRQSSESADALICSQGAGEAVCAPTRFYSKPYLIAMRNDRGEPNLPMNRALLGQRGVSHAVDLRGVPVVAGYGPVGSYGIGLVLKNDVATLYAPLRGQLYLIVATVGVLVAAGTLAMRARVRPLLATIVAEQQRTKAILETAGDAFIAVDVEGKVSDWNPEAERMFGWRATEALGRTLDQLIVPASQHAAHARGFQKFKETGNGDIINRRSDLVGLHKDGTEIAVEMMVTAQRVEGGFVANAFLRDVRERKEAQRQLARSEQRLRDVLTSTPALVCQFDIEQRCIFVNDVQLLENCDTPTAALGQKARDLLGPVRYALHLPYILEALAGRRTQLESAINMQGKDTHFQAHLVPEFGADSNVSGFYLMSFDVTTLKELQFQTEQDRRRLRAITDNLPVMISYIDREHRFQFLNRTFEEWTGVPIANAIGRPLHEILGPELYAQRVDSLRRSLEGERVLFEVESHAAGVDRILQTVYIPDMTSVNEVVGVYTLTTDVTLIRRSEQEMADLAMTDTVTGIANRRHFDASLKAALHDMQDGELAALMFLDVDHFKAINDTYGHATGDAVLIECAARLTAAVGNKNLPARIAGDEFAVVVPKVQSAAEVNELTHKVLVALRQPIVLSGQTLNVTSSIGVALLVAGQSTDARSALAAADHALYESKRAGRNRFTVYSPGVGEVLPH